MTLNEIEIGQEVICTSLSEDVPFEDSINREIGHIGRVVSIFPLTEIILVGHIEFTGTGETGYVEFITHFLSNELSVYEHEVTPLQEAIKKTIVQITRK